MAEFAQIDEDLARLEGQAARAGGAAKQRLLAEIEKLRQLRQKLIASNDALIATGADDPNLERAAEEAIFDLDQDLP